MCVLVIRTVLVAVLFAAVGGPGTAHAGPAPPSGRVVECPEWTADPARYPGAMAPYRCRSAVTDMFGNVVLLREGQPGSGGFGLRHAVEDGAIATAVLERVVRTARPRSAPQRRVSYVERVHQPGGAGVVDVWVAVDRAPSTAAPDTEAFGLLTAYCRDGGDPGQVHRCPDWLNR